MSGQVQKTGDGVDDGECRLSKQRRGVSGQVQQTGGGMETETCSRGLTRESPSSFTCSFSILVLICLFVACVFFPKPQGSSEGKCKCVCVCGGGAGAGGRRKDEAVAMLVVGGEDDLATSPHANANPELTYGLDESP